MHTLTLRSGVLQALVALWAGAAWAQLAISESPSAAKLPFAAGVDSTGWAQARSNAAGQVMIESPEYPRGLWLQLVDEAGQALDGMRVEYQGRRDGLVAIRCLDPAGLWRERLLWSQPESDPLRLTLQSGESVDLPADLIPIDWQIYPSAESLLEPVAETQLTGWEEVEAFLRTRWKGRSGRVAVQLNAGTSLSVDLDHPEALETLVAYLQHMELSEDAMLAGGAGLEVRVFEGSLALLEGVILSTAILFEDPALEAEVRRALGQPRGAITRRDVASLSELWGVGSAIHSLAGLEQFAALRRLELDRNQIADLSPLASLTNLQTLVLRSNQIADVNPLTAMANLGVLMLTYNQVADVTPLAFLTNLRWLCLTGNLVADVTPLASLTNLERLWLPGNQVVDVTPLAGLTNLSTLWLGNNQIEDISPLIANTGLGAGDRISLGGNPLNDQALIEHIPALKARGVSVRF